MKKQFLTLLIALVLSTFTFAQSGFNIGGSIGFPYENYEGYDFSFAFSVDANYLFEVNQAFDIGLATGYGQAFGDSYYIGPIIGSFDTPDYQYVPVAAAARINVNRRLVFGADIGYAISVTSAKDYLNNKYYDGGFYWRPMVGFNLNERLQLNFNYIGISDNYFYYSAFNLGFMVNL
ncbi:hypothetical protein [Xanthomarina sp. GH4-25]|uniref:hypothetical protein n=1 Tax=Xanthomarina sp. GH4-25 TaxID=3349335 RepID=UPI003877CC68